MGEETIHNPSQNTSNLKPFWIITVKKDPPNMAKIEIFGNFEVLLCMYYVVYLEFFGSGGKILT